MRFVETGGVEMMAGRPSVGSVDEYIAGFPPATARMLQELRALIRSIAPSATETISYGIPTFDLEGTHLVHFAGYGAHIGLYPAPSGIAAFHDEPAPYKRAKGSVRFPLDRPLPSDLIRRMVAFRVEEVVGASQKQGGRGARYERPALPGAVVSGAPTAARPRTTAARPLTVGGSPVAARCRRLVFRLSCGPRRRTPS